MKKNLEEVIWENWERKKKRKRGGNEKNLRKIRCLLRKKVLKNFNLPLTGDNVRRYRVKIGKFKQEITR